MRKGFFGFVLSPLPFAFSLVSAMLVALCVCVGAQQTGKIPRIGYLLAAGSPETPRRDAFRQGLRDLGYVEDKNIIIEWREAEGRLDRLDELAAELVRLKVDVFVVSGNSVVRAAKRATSTIPIVTTLVSDPVENGFVASLSRPGGNITGLTSLGAELSGKRLELLKEVVPRLSRLMVFMSSPSPGNSQTVHGNGLVASLARPGGNITGLSVLSPELGGKRLELLKEIVPKLTRVAVLGSSTLPGNAQTLRETELAAGALGVTLQYVDLLNPKDIEAAFRAASKRRAEAVLALGTRCSMLTEHKLQISR
jgi:ABC-type uncharacterized transport system substrate-binding protein